MRIIKSIWFDQLEDSFPIKNKYRSLVACENQLPAWTIESVNENLAQAFTGLRFLRFIAQLFCVLLQLNMFDAPLMLQVNWPVVDTIHP